MLIFLCSTTPKFNSKNSQFINKKSKSTIKRDQTINGFHNKVNQDLKSIKMVDSIDMPSLEKTKKTREDFDVGDLEHVLFSEI